jgi:hypothetical protein
MGIPLKSRTGIPVTVPSATNPFRPFASFSCETVVQLLTRNWRDTPILRFASASVNRIPLLGKMAPHLYHKRE